MICLSSGESLEAILRKISKNLIEDSQNVSKCSEIPTQIKEFYMKDIEPFMQKHKGALKFSSDEKKREEKFKDVYRGATFYNEKAKHFFGFFGVNLDQQVKQSEFQLPQINHIQLVSFLYSSVQMLYILLWEVLQDFLEPLEGLYFQRLCDSGVFPQDFKLFPEQEDVQDIIKLNFIKDVKGRDIGLYRVSEKFPFELRLVFLLSKGYYTKCFKEVESCINSTSEDIVNDFITLFIVRNNASHIGESVQIQGLSEDMMLRLFYHLSLKLPSIQNSCIGIISLFRSFANNEPE